MAGAILHVIGALAPTLSPFWGIVGRLGRKSQEANEREAVARLELQPLVGEAIPGLEEKELDYDDRVDVGSTPIRRSVVVDAINDLFKWIPVDKLVHAGHPITQGSDLLVLLLEDLFFK